MKKVKSWRKTYSSSRTIVKVYERLVSDLAACSSLPDNYVRRIHGDIKFFLMTDDFRPLRETLDALPIATNLDPVAFKHIYQVKNFFKRWIFSTDKYTTDERSALTVAKFLEVQEHIGRRHELSYKTKLVLQRARQIVKQALGPVDHDELALSCRFSTKACVGFPTPRSYLHDKFAGPISGSSSHIEWLLDHSAKDSILRDECLMIPYHDGDGVFYNLSCVDTLNYHEVPKSFKINRGMTPNTLAGSYKSRGIGKMLERRLLNVGIDLSRQPELHKVLARKSSISRSLVTADLSSASDTFTSELMNMLLPRDWFRLVNEGRSHHIKICERVYSLQSFMAMGIGFTFPLQTLLYYAIIKAIQELHGSRGTISVFGDDLIYPRGLHRFVVSVLTDCKFRINIDKTFVHSNFRESCGGDFFHGIDVRPCQPEGEAQSLGKWEYVSLLHKLANGLTLRFCEEEIPSTILFITKELAAVAPVMVVPDDFPDYSGLKRVSVRREYLLCAKTGRNLNGSFVFPCLLEQPKQKHVPSLIGYYWDKLRQMAEDDTFGVEQEFVIKGIFKKAVPRDLYGSVLDTIRWHKKPRAIRELGVKPKFYRCRRTARRVAIWEPSVTDKQAKPILVVQQAISILAS